MAARYGISPIPLGSITPHSRDGPPKMWLKGGLQPASQEEKPDPRSILAIATHATALAMTENRHPCLDGGWKCDALKTILGPFGSLRVQRLVFRFAAAVTTPVILQSANPGFGKSFAPGAQAAF